MRYLRVTVAGLSLTVLSACPDAGVTAPSAAESAAVGHYNLVTVDGAALPAGIGNYTYGPRAAPPGCNLFVDAGTLDLFIATKHTDGRNPYSLAVTIRSVCPTFDTFVSGSSVEGGAGHWSNGGDQLVLTRESGDIMGAATGLSNGSDFTVYVQLSSSDLDHAIPSLPFHFRR